MTVLEDLRATIQRIIAENPLQIAVHRVTRVDDGAGGWTRQESDLAGFTGRLVPSQRYQRMQDEAGVTKLAEFFLLAPYGADLSDATNVEDTFSVSGRKYRVARVIFRNWHGEVYAVHAMLEEVS